MERGRARKRAGRRPAAATELNKAARKKALASGASSLDFMLAIMRGEDIPRADLFEAAKAAAPYVHARLADVEHSNQICVKDASEVTDDELANIAAGSKEELLKLRLIRRSSIEWCRYCGFKPAADHKPLIEKLEQVALGASDQPTRFGGYRGGEGNVTLRSDGLSRCCKRVSSEIEQHRKGEKFVRAGPWHSRHTIAPVE